VFSVKDSWFFSVARFFARKTDVKHPSGCLVLLGSPCRICDVVRYPGIGAPPLLPLFFKHLFRPAVVSSSGFVRWVRDRGACLRKVLREEKSCRRKGLLTTEDTEEETQRESKKLLIVGNLP
jgi:hypothetical protein